MRKTLGIAALGSTVAIVVACSSSTPTANVALSVNGDAGTAPYDAAPPPAPPASSGQPPASGPVFFTGDSGAPPATSASAAPSGSDAGALGPSALGGQALDQGIDIAITTASPKVAPKMTRGGDIGRETLAEGGHFGMVVTLAPNTCYTFIGFSPPGGVEKLDLKLYGPLPLNAEAAKSGASDKAMPVMGKGTAAICPISPLPSVYKLDAAATKGAGRIGVHVYSRPR